MISIRPTLKGEKISKNDPLMIAFMEGMLGGNKIEEDKKMKNDSDIFIIKKIDGTEERLYANYVEVTPKAYIFSEEYNGTSDRLLLSIPIKQVEMVYKQGVLL